MSGTFSSANRPQRPFTGWTIPVYVPGNGEYPMIRYQAENETAEARAAWEAMARQHELRMAWWPIGLADTDAPFR